MSLLPRVEPRSHAGAIARRSARLRAKHLEAARPGAMRLALAYLELTKPRIVSLVLFTGLPALLMARPGYPGARVFWGALAGIAAAAASAASFNHYLDRDIDALMKRTALRPLPAGMLPPSHALGVGFLLAAVAWWVLVSTANVLAASIAMASIVYYAVVYTAWLKRRTPQNIVIGGGAGASAPLIAWAAATGQVGLPAVLLASIIFLWTPPHFWALSLYRRDDYARAGIPMLPVTHGEAETRRQILIYSLILVPVTLALAGLGVVGPAYWIPASLLGALFIAFAVRLSRSGRVPHAIRLFRYSILYLFLLFGALTIDALSGILPG
jgi:heme o synthase